MTLYEKRDFSLLDIRQHETGPIVMVTPFHIRQWLAICAARGPVADA